MARKQRLGESTDVYFDTRTKAVLTQTSYNSMANVKEQLTCVREVVPHCKKEDIVLILQHFDGDVQKTIQAFMEGTAEDILKEWNIPNKRKTGPNISKKNKKKSNKHTISQEDGTPVPNGVQEEHIPASSDKVKLVGSKSEANHQHDNQHMTRSIDTSSSMSGSLQQQRPQQHQSNNIKKGAIQINTKDSHSSKPNEVQESRELHKQVQLHSKNPRQGSAKANKQHHADKPSLGPAHDNRTGNDRHTDQKHGPNEKRERNLSESSLVTDSSKSKKAGSTLEKSSKDLQRTVVSLTRHKNLLADEIEKAEKRLKKACDDARTSLNAREEDLLKHIQEVKRHATALLEDRQHEAFELKQQISQAPVKSEPDLVELRADIKHFVSERKIDEEIGRSSRFTGNVDALQQTIKSFGEVLGVKNVYSIRHKSLTSPTSMESQTRPTSMSDAHNGSVSTPLSVLEDSVKKGNDTAILPVTPVSPASPDIDMDSEVAKLAAKMQRSMQGSRGNGPRKPRQHVKNPQQVERGNKARQRYSNYEENKQHQKAVRDQQDGKSQNNRLDKKPRNDNGYQGRRNDRARNDRPSNGPDEGGREKEGQKNKNRFNRRREQQRKSDQGDDYRVFRDVKKNAFPMPSPAISDKNTPIITNTSKTPKPHFSPKKKMEADEVSLHNGKGSVESWQAEALPQRKPLNEQRVKKEVAKEVTFMNGMMNGDPSPLIINGKDKGFPDEKAQLSGISGDK